MDLVVKSQGVLHGEVQVPGDKSISHRAIMLGALSEGKTTIQGLLEGKDCLATVQALRQLGVVIERLAEGSYCVHGVGLQGFTPSDTPLDCGNSGTAMRLMAGLLAGLPFESMLIGDNSLQNRPMQRITEPLTKMGVCIQGLYPPLRIVGSTELSALNYTLPVASSQVKSCLLFAGLFAKEKTVLREKDLTRDHTERMLKAFGAKIEINGNEITLTPSKLTGQALSIPGDISSAAFFIAGAAMTPGSHIVIRSVGVNERRLGMITILRKMGAHIEILNERMISGEPVGDIEVRGAKLRGISVPREWVVSAMDEFPILFIAAASATGKTVIRGIAELRVKESDRIQMMSQGLNALGGQMKDSEDGVEIQGGLLSGGAVDSGGDHRIAMAFAMASLIANNSITIRDCDNIATSFPNFCTLAQHLGLKIEKQRRLD